MTCIVNLTPHRHTIIRVLILLVAIACGVRCSHATLLFYEPFPDAYTNGCKLGLGGSGQTAAQSPSSNVWAFGNSASGSSPTVSSAAALSYAGLTTSNSSYGVVMSTGSGKNAGRAFSSQTLSAGNPTLYASFLLQPRSGMQTNRTIVYLRTSSAGTPYAGVYISTNAQGESRLQVLKNSATPAAAVTSVLNSNTTYFVVLRYKFNSSSSSDDEVGLWLNPVTGQTNPPGAGTPDISTTSGTDNTTMSVFWIAGDVAETTGSPDIDEIRVGTTWADVTPSGNYQPVSATNSILSISPPVTNINKSVLVTVTEYDPGNNAMTNAGVAPVLSTSDGKLGTVTALGNGIYTATLTVTNPGYASVTGTISGTPIGNGAGVSAYFAGTIGTNGTFNFSHGFFPGTYAINFNAVAGQIFSVHSTTNLALPLASWTLETDLAIADSTTMSETTYPGALSSYSFTVQPPADSQIFYRVSSP